MAHGIYVEDEHGKTYLDFMAGTTNAVGYSHPKVTNAVRRQVEEGFDNIGFSQLHNDLADVIRNLAPQELSTGRISFGHSGSDILEKSIRLARYATNKPIILSFFEAHHGVNATALSASPSMRFMGTDTIGRFFQLPGFLYVPFPDSYRPWFGKGADPSEASLSFVERLLSSVVSRDLISALIVEPILSLGGNIVPPDGYFQKLRRICKENNILFIADEVLTGIGKTGRMFAMENWNVSSDAICLGKALSGGLPLSLMIAKKDLVDEWEAKDEAGFCKEGHRLGCACAISTLQVIREEHLVQNSKKMGEYLRKRLEDLKKEQEILGEIRGLGLLIGFDLVTSEKTRNPDTRLAKNVVNRALEEGLILGTVGASQNVIRFMPALILEEKHVDKAIEILGKAFRNARR